MEKKIAIIGCGNLGSAIVQGLLDGGMAPTSIIATRRNVVALSSLQDQGVGVTSDNNEAASTADILLLCVKPYNLLSVLESMRGQLRPNQIIISAATGISLDEIRQAVHLDNAVFRAMPNTAADVKESVTCLCYTKASATQVSDVLQIFDEVGQTIVIDESLMEAATVLGACGIAYVLRFMRGMIQGGIEIGFSADVAKRIVSQTVKGAAELLITRQQHPEHEIDKVTTPRGCTITGLNEMEHNGFSSSLIKGITASFDKIN